MITIYERLGDDNLKLLVDRFYDLVQQNDVISHLFKTDIKEVKKKQFFFLTQFFGGPPRYAEEYGHPRLRMKHMPHEVTKEGTMAWLECMAHALDSLPIEEEFKDEIFNRFPQAAAHMINR